APPRHARRDLPEGDGTHHANGGRSGSLMAVYKRSYRPYRGPLTGRLARFMVLPRNAWRRLYQQRLVLLLTMLAYIWPLVCAGFIYLTNRAPLLEGLDPDFRQ